MRYLWADGRKEGRTKGQGDSSDDDHGDHNDDDDSDLKRSLTGGSGQEGWWTIGSGENQSSRSLFN